MQATSLNQLSLVRLPLRVQRWSPVGRCGQAVGEAEHSRVPKEVAGEGEGEGEGMARRPLKEALEVLHLLVGVEEAGEEALVEKRMPAE